MTSFKDSTNPSSLPRNESYSGTDKSLDEGSGDNPNRLNIENGASKSHKSGIYQSVVRALTLSRRESELRFRRLFRNMPIALAWNRIVLDDDGNPCDYIFVDVNDAFEKLTGLKKRDVLGNTVTKVFPDIKESEFDWIGTFGKVALTGKKIEFEQWFEPLGKWLSIAAYRPAKHNFVTLITNTTEQRLAEKTIREQHDFLEEVKESLTHPFYVIDANDYTVTMANDASGFGILPEDSTCYALTHNRNFPCEGEDHPCPLLEVKKTKKPVVMNHTHYDKDGNARQLEINAYPIFDDSGNVIRIIEYDIDITERHQAEIALKESEERHRTLIQSINDMIFVISKDNHFSQFYSSSRDLLLAPPQEFLGKSIIDVLPPNIAQPYLELSKIVRKTGERQNLEYSLDIGENQHWFLATLDLHEDGESIVSVIRNITERKQVEDALKRSETSLAEAQRIAHLGSWDLDTVTDELHWSAEIYNIFGVAPEDFDGTYDAFLELVHPSDRELVKASVDRAIMEKEPYSIDHRIIRPDGSERIVHEQGELRYDDDGNVIRMIGTVLDITAFKAVEKQLQMTSKRAKMYLDLMGHDIVNQLQIIMSCNALLGEKQSLSENGYLNEIINDAVNECERIMSKTKSTEHLADTPLYLRDLRSVVTDCIDAVREDNEYLVIESIFTVNQAPIIADDLLECLVDNLLENAIKHNTSQELQIWVKILQKDYGFEMSMADNGSGIRDNIKKDLFNSTRRFGGVGLHQVKEILEKYKGSVEVCDRVSNRPEYGVEFRLWFPKATHKLVTKNAERNEKIPNKGES